MHITSEIRNPKSEGNSNGKVRRSRIPRWPEPRFGFRASGFFRGSNIRLSSFHPTASLAFLIASLPVLPLLAQDAGTNQPARLPEVVVTATRLPEQTTTPDKLPANITVLTRDDVAKSPAATLTELLRQQEGFTMLDSVGYGSGGPNASFALRGFGEKSGALILVDGVRVNDAGTGFFLWNSVPLSAIERVEIIRGGASTIYGEGAAAGVINIVTKQAENKPFAGSVGASIGNLGYYQGNFTVSGRTNNFSYVVTGSRNEWAGWRDGANFRGWNFLAKPSLETPAGKFTLSYQFHDDHGENPDILTPAQYAANPRQRGATQFTFEQALHRGWLDYQKSFDDAWTVNAKAFLTKDDAFNSGFASVTTAQPGYGGTVQVDWKTEPWRRENTLTLGGEAARQDFSQTVSSFFGTTTTVYDSSTLGFFAQDTFKLTPKLTLTAGTRFDHRSTFLDVPNLFPPPAPFTGGKENNVWSPKGSLAWEFAEKSSAWAALSQAYRLPSASDVVSGDPRFTSNPALVPVDARTVEVGFRTRQHEILGGSLTLFRSWVEDDVFLDPATFGNANADALKQGVELTLNSRPAERVDFQLSTTFTDAHFTSGAYRGQHLILVPEWQVNAAMNLRPTAGLTWRIESVYVTGLRRVNDLPNTLASTTYTVVNTKLSYQWRNVTTYAAVNNLLDRRYEQFPSYNAFAGIQHNPAPGINFQFGVNVAF
ncbi:MAG: TonB-dependent receptor [Verrucomicrobia bacterium]|nr:TonB-dependent receptor [Verrucomicrobiota bacterium]